MKQQLREVRAAHKFDCMVCDFVTPAPNLDSLKGCVLFQHNVETMIWRRMQEHAPDPLRRAYFRLQAERMFRLEKKSYLEAAHVIAVSDADAPDDARYVRTTRDQVRADRRGYRLLPPGRSQLVPGRILGRTWSLSAPWTGCRTWMARNILSVKILPLIWRERPECTVTLVGRAPLEEVLALGRSDSRIRVTGTVPDVRPYLWGSQVSIVPLRIGGGTRLKIYESMAGGVPVVSTTVGAEGLDVKHPGNIRLADTAEAFAAECLETAERCTGPRPYGGGRSPSGHLAFFRGTVLHGISKRFSSGLRNVWNSGFFWTGRGQAGRSAKRSLVTAMTDAIAHRGPDDSGFFGGMPPRASRSASAASPSSICRRKATSPWPATEATGSLFFNGEIYNFQETAQGTGRARLPLSGPFRYRDHACRLRTVGHGCFSAPFLTGMFCVCLVESP